MSTEGDMQGKNEQIKAPLPSRSELAVDLVLRGMRRTDVARMLGVGRQLVTTACQRAGVKNVRIHRTSPAGSAAKADAAARAAAAYRKAHGLPDPLAIVRDRQLGMTFREIAAKYGGTEGQVCKVFQRYQQGSYRTLRQGGA